MLAVCGDPAAAAAPLAQAARTGVEVTAMPAAGAARLRSGGLRWLPAWLGGGHFDLVLIDDADGAGLDARGAARVIAALRRGGVLAFREARPRAAVALLDRLPPRHGLVRDEIDDGTGALRLYRLERAPAAGAVRVVRRVDACILYNEIDLLQIRLEELWEQVDHFVVVEADETFAGAPKPLFFRAHEARFARYREKLVYHPIAGLPAIGRQSEEARFAREAAQRDAIGAALARLPLAPDDIVIVGDVDEIPRGSAVAEIERSLAGPDYAIFLLSNHRGYVNNVSAAALNRRTIAGPVACRVRTLRREGAHAVRRGRGKSGGVISRRSPAYAYVENGGWHFYSLGGPEAVWLKAANFSHIEDPYRVIRLGGGAVGQRVFDAALDREACRVQQRRYLEHCDSPEFSPLEYDRFDIVEDVPAFMRAHKERFRGFFYFTDLD